MMRRYSAYLILILLLGTSHRVATAATAGDPGADDLTITAGGKSEAVVVVSPQAGTQEKQAAEDLAHYIGLMSGATPEIARTSGAIDVAMAGNAPLLVIGQRALQADARLGGAIDAVLKKNAHLRTDGIILKRDGNRVYLAGNNDRSHYFAVAELLRRWGCRWYIPTDFGECVPEEAELRVGDLDYVYSSPFEIRAYWISWNGDGAGAAEFQARNMMTGRGAMPPTGHALGKFTGGAPGSKGMFNFAITAPATAEHVAGQIESSFASGGKISLGMEDGNYDSDYPRDQELMKLQWDKYFLRWSVTDPMLELYNNVSRILLKKYPDSQAQIGFLAYANMTIPPVRDMVAERSLYCELAPIDIDPIHGMDDPQSPPRQEYREMLHKWAKVMQGRLAIYDYDQGMLVWRDIPNPSHQSFRQDVQHYREAGILGVNTESRNAIGTTFLNLYMRARLLWNPDEDVDALLAEFYPKFYGPAAQPMQIYWNTIYEAWENTICTEHEYFVAPAIYTPDVIETCRKSLADAEKRVAPLKNKAAPTRREQQVLDRLRFTRMSFEIIDGYLSMVHAAATEVDYKKAAQIGNKTLAVRERMTEMNGIFTTYRRMPEGGSPWWPGEARQYSELAQLLDGTRGTLIAKLPEKWAFRRDKARVGVKGKYATQDVDLAYWEASRDGLTARSRKDYPDEWEVLRTDLYAQAQGIRDPDRQSFTGDMWYRTDVELPAGQVKGKVHLMFPGLFNECWLYVNGEEAGYRKQGDLWWLNDYKFEWDVDLAGQLKSGKNTIVLRANCEHHFGGMFRRPFLYRPTGKEN